MAGAVEVDTAVAAAEGKSCCTQEVKKGPGYASPLEAMKGPREALIYVTCVYNGELARNLSRSLSLSSQF